MLEHLRLRCCYFTALCGVRVCSIWGDMAAKDMINVVVVLRVHACMHREVLVLWPRWWMSWNFKWVVYSLNKSLFLDPCAHSLLSLFKGHGVTAFGDYVIDSFFQPRHETFTSYFESFVQYYHCSTLVLHQHHHNFLIAPRKINKNALG